MYTFKATNFNTILITSLVRGNAKGVCNLELKHSKDIETFISRVQKWLDTKGPEGTIKRIKTLRLTLIKGLADKDFKRDPKIRSNSHGLPSDLPFQRHIILRDLRYIRLTLTCLTISRLIKGGPEKGNFDPITRPLEVQQEDVIKLGRMAATIASQLHLPTLNSEWTEYHQTGSKGPMGGAIFSAVLEFQYITPEHGDKLFILGGTKFKDIVEKLRITLPLDFFENINKKYSVTPQLRKISYIKDPEAKLRIICIFDYGSQTVLKPIHDDLFRLLSLFPSDCTFNQSEGLKAKGPYWCFDLTSATDRFPLLFQVEVMKRFIGEEKALAGGGVMSQLEIKTPHGDTIKYNCGQPMGAYTSGASFTLCHHLVVQLASQKVYPNRGLFNDYCLLGDDIVILDESVAREYLVIMKTLGVEINLSKSVVSDTTIEFAKRGFYNQVEISPLSLRALIDTHKDGCQLGSVINNFKDRTEQDLLSIPCLKELVQIFVKRAKGSARLAAKMHHLRLLQIIVTKKKHLDSYIAAREYLLRCGMDMGCNRFKFNLEYLLELLAGLYLQTIQDSLISTYKETNKLLAELNKLMGGQGLPRELPPVYLLSIKTTELQTEGKLVSEIVQDQDWFAIINLDVNGLPDPRRIISGKYDTSKGTPNNMVNRTLDFIKHELEN